jgi:DHA2 family multidrug resistance protein
MKQLSLIVHRQAVIMSFSDAFFVLTVFYVVLSTLVVLLDKPDMSGSRANSHGKWFERRKGQSL